MTPLSIFILKVILGFLFAVTQILFVFTKMFNKARDENEQAADAEKKKLEKEAQKEAAAANSAAKKEAAAAADTNTDRSKDIKGMIHNQFQLLKQRETQHNTTR